MFVKNTKTRDPGPKVEEDGKKGRLTFIPPASTEPIFIATYWHLSRRFNDNYYHKGEEGIRCTAVVTVVFLRLSSNQAVEIKQNTSGPVVD